MRTPGLLLAALACIALQGCIAVAAIAVAGAHYDEEDRNEVSMDVTADVERTWGATLAALRHMGYAVRHDHPRDESGGTIELTTDDLWMRVEKLTASMTRIRARLGGEYHHDKVRRANLILEAIRKRLPQPVR